MIILCSQDDTIILIEETKDQHKEYHYLENQKQFIDRYIRQENRLKAYGSTYYVDLRYDLLGTKKYSSGSSSGIEDAIFFNNQKLLRSVLFVDEVEILLMNLSANYQNMQLLLELHECPKPKVLEEYAIHEVVHRP